MLVDNYNKTTEGIAARTFQITSGKKYALSFFLSSSALSNYRTDGGTYTFKIFLAHCQNFDVTKSGNPEIIAEKQLIYCRSFEFMGDSDWQQYFVSFTPEIDYDMIVIYPEVPDNGYDGGTYVHFLYPELIPINPTNQYSTYLVPPDSTQGITLLSACGVTNASYQWTGPNGVVSEQACDVLAYSPSIGENDLYTFSIWVESAMGNDLEFCEDANVPTITDTAIQLPTTELVNCADPVTATNDCNIIPNATFTKTPGTAPNVDAFRQDRVQFWSSVNGGTPDINGAAFAGTLPTALPPNVPITANAASMTIHTGIANYSYEGIYAKIPHLTAGNTYAFSFFLHTVSIIDDGPADFTFNVILGNCQQFQITPDFFGTTTPPNLNLTPTPQSILCQRFPGVVTTGWQQYFVTFTANDNWEMMVIYPQGNPGFDGESYVHFLYPELIDVTNSITVTETSACNYTLEACGVINATYQWHDGDNNLIGISNPINVNAAINPPLYTLTLSVPGISNNNITNTCSNNSGTTNALAGKQATWVGGTTGPPSTNPTDWSIAANWNPAVVPDDALTDVLIPATTNQPTIYAGSIGEPFQVNSINIQSGGKLTNLGTLQVARNITRGGTGSIDNYLTTVTPSTHVITGSIEMNGTCKAQTLAGNVFVTNDVKKFTVSNNVTISSTSGEGLKVHGELGFGSVAGTILNTGTVTGDNLTLVSTASTTANVAQITDATNIISGDVIVERYIMTGTGTNEHLKTWQALATPTGANSTGQSVYNSWMEAGNNASTGYGTHIPDPSWTVSLTNGFDGSALIPSIKTYNPVTNGFNPIANTSIPLYNKNGYFLFVRGDRSKTLLSSTPNPTNLRSKGELFQPHTGYAPPNVTVQAGLFQLVGNPYASAIDIQTMATNGNFQNLTNVVYVWDPLLPGTQGYGAYQTLSAANSYIPSPGGTTTYPSGVARTEIQSGQAFFVKSPTIAGSVSFDESIKTSNSHIVTRTTSTTSRKSFRADLYSGTGLCDGNLEVFGSAFSNDIDADDASKLLNPGENFMILSDNKFFSIEARYNFIQGTSISYTFSNMRKIKYQVKFTPQYLQGEDLHAALIDNYLHKRIPLSLTDSSFVDFDVDDNNASYENRFIVIFERDTNLGEKTTTVSTNKNDSLNIGTFIIYPNPTENKTIRIAFVNKASGSYILQLLDNGGQVVNKGIIKINNANETSVIKLSNSVPAGSYELMILAPDGKRSMHQVHVK